MNMIASKYTPAVKTAQGWKRSTFKYGFSSAEVRRILREEAEVQRESSK